VGRSAVGQANGCCPVAPGDVGASVMVLRTTTQVAGVMSASLALRCALRPIKSSVVGLNRLSQS
jgi:hypothetical protein